MSNIPAALKAITPYDRRASEVERTGDPRAYIISYFCRYYAMELGIKVANKDKSPDVQNYLLDLMTKLEKEKSVHKDLDNAIACRAVVTAFAAEKLQQAEEEYFGMVADKNTSRLYYAAASFFEVLATFEDDKVLDEVTKKSVLYSKWRATEILKAIKEGRNPVPKEGETQLGEESEEEPDMPPPAPTNTTFTQKEETYDNGYSKPPTRNTSPSKRMSSKKATSEEVSRSNITDDNRSDAEEYCRFVLTSLRQRDDESAIKYLYLALEQLGER